MNQRFSDYLTNLIIKQGIGFIAILTIVLAFTLLLRWEHPLLEPGVIFILLGLGYCFDADQQRKTTVFKVSLVRSIFLIGMSTPPLLILMAIAPTIIIALLQDELV
ncbi:hypothetical protein [Pleurocapsa sp. FMAR1]|uniref:hypothetical protein n=1 Tax=Pleurocapsa sp. FMAR1 TaxID=3040204 RepID=UPI0029C97E6A|nr:hypothetical protein [Pleurocapsa sp. FMAR1]